MTGPESPLIVPFREDLAPDFMRLNRAWIDQFFAMEDADWEILGDPAAIVARGGQIFFALDGPTAVGTAAAIRVAPSRFELAKMAVDPACQGRGIGRRLGEAVIEFARAAGAETVFLVTNGSMAAAVRLYERLGFEHGPFPPESAYARSNVYMELALGRSMPAAFPLTLRPAALDDLDAIVRGIEALAEYERLPVVATADQLRDALFGPGATAEVVLAYAGAELAGYMLFFPTLSTFTGRRGLYLEDLFVWPAWRGRGIGRALLARLARTAVERGYGRVEWAVLDWNESAIRFYRELGAEAMTEWTVYRLAGPALEALAAE